MLFGIQVFRSKGWNPCLRVVGRSINDACFLLWRACRTMDGRSAFPIFALRQTYFDSLRAGRTNELGKTVPANFSGVHEGHDKTNRMA